MAEMDAEVDADAQPQWTSACGQIIRATRRAEELLQPLLQVEIVPADSDVFTHRTASRHPQDPAAGSATVVTWSVTDDIRTEGEHEASDLPEATAAGQLTATRQSLEHRLLELKQQYGNIDHLDIAETLDELGWVCLQAGDLTQAKQNLDESLQMKRSICFDGDHHYIAATLHQLGCVSRRNGDLDGAKQQLEAALQIERSVHGDRDHPHIAATLHELGCVSRQTRNLADLAEAQQQLEESLRMKRSVHGDREHPDIAETLHELGCVSRQTGHLTRAKQQLEESLRMKRSLRLDGDHHDIVATLHELGCVIRQTGDLSEAQQHFDECLLRMTRSEPRVAVVLHELQTLRPEVSRQVSQQAEDLQIKHSSLYFVLSVFVVVFMLHVVDIIYGCFASCVVLLGVTQKSRKASKNTKKVWLLEGSGNSASTRCSPSRVSDLSGDLAQAKQKLEYVLQMERSMFGEQEAPPLIAAPLDRHHHLGLEDTDLATKATKAMKAMKAMKGWLL